MKRILVLGPSGSGKSTLGERIGRILDIPIVHLDQYYWKPGWIYTPEDEWRAKIEELISADEWVMDGNYTSSLKLRSSAADTIIFIDIPRRLSYLRIFIRFLRFRGRTRPDLGEACPEKIDIDFIRWIWNYPRTRGSVILRFLEKLGATKSVYILHNQREINEFLKEIGKKDGRDGRI